MLRLKIYQERCLAILESYLRRAVEVGAKAAFDEREDARGRYRSIALLPGLPYVCLRVPTGGGKTLMASHALGIAARSYLHADRALCLWLVPTNTIREQTLAALRNREHPYRQAIDATFGGQVRVMDLSEALYVRRASLEGETCIVVSTLAALRVEETEGRKVYEANGALQAHFTGVSEEVSARLEMGEERIVIPSLANVFRMWRPIIIMDEAHNARTPLSFETLARVGPACILEFTATPETRHRPEQELWASNVLTHVSAAELKHEEMIKLPIKLQTGSDWKRIVGDALDAQRTLEGIASEEEKQTGEYIRPIVLLQAQAHRQDRPTVTVEVLKASLIDDFKVPEQQIAIATGQRREIKDIDLFERACPIRFIITVEALKEGWDCSFAYVLCSVAEVVSARRVEQILGRVLRLPRAHRKQRPDLNCAYAFAVSPRFIEAASALKDALVENGFQHFETRAMVEDAAPAALFRFGVLRPAVGETSERPDFSGLEPELRARIAFDESTRELTLPGALDEVQIRAIKACFRNETDRQTVEQICRGAATAISPQAAREPASMDVPLLAVRVNGQLELFDDSFFLDHEWDLAQCDATLPEAELALTSPDAERGEVDVDEVGEIRFVRDLHEQLSFLGMEPGWTVASLAIWLDRNIWHRDVPQAQSSLFIHRALTGLIETRGLGIGQLARIKYRLKNAIECAIDRYRAAAARQAYQQWLFGPDAGAIEVDANFVLTMSSDRYGPHLPYSGPLHFRKHLFNVIGDLEAEGEQFECAEFLDRLPEVKHWVRNIERDPNSFWLQTSTDKFYPDFVALLEDGRILVVEYKGEDRWSNDDSKEKRAVGELWAERSNNRCMFVMPKGRDFALIKTTIGR
jgi:type III restriction enzyme